MVPEDHPSDIANVFNFQRSFVELKECLESVSVTEFFEKTLDAVAVYPTLSDPN